MVNYLIDIARNFRVADFFDISIISVLTYAVLIWFRRTASRFVLIGISILGVVYVLARVFDLYLTVFVFQGFFAVLLIALIIIFQEDLRLFFERLARWGAMRRGWSSVSSRAHIDVLTQTVTNLSLKRFGALIVLKGTDHLDRHFKGGTFLEGRVSEALLESLFDRHSVGHDGAVVIADGQVVRFACRLPLSLNTKKIGNLGLRHTAALGLAERSDALVIVVSEERGTITVARDGRLRKLENIDQLKTILDHFYREREPRAKKKTWFGRWGKNHWEKVIAVVFACGLWLAFGYQAESIRRGFAVPIEYRNLPPDWFIEEPRSKEATVTLMGSGQAFDLLNPQTLKIVLDMSKVQEGKQEVQLKPDQVRHPSNLSVVGIEPGKIALTTHKMILLNASIKVQTSGKLSPGLALRQIMVEPKSIQVMGPPHTKKRAQILTEPINLQDITATTILSSKLVLPANTRFVSDTPPTVQVTVEIEERKSPK
jgi:diadenylate cyclase